MKQPELIKQTENIICHFPFYTTVNKLTILAKMMEPFKHKQGFSPLYPPDKHFIVNKIVRYLKSQSFLDISKELVIADIGGGDGTILTLLGEQLSLPKSQLFCIENAEAWSESYDFTKNDPFIQTIFWDNKTFPVIPSDSLDIILAMVSLHHMTNETINSLMTNLKRVAKPNAIVLVKEHDCKTTRDKFLIDWEHHLYHISETTFEKNINTGQMKQQITDYLTKNYIDNFKPKEELDRIFKKHGFIGVDCLNRFLERGADENPTKLYWRVYQMCK